MRRSGYSSISAKNRRRIGVSFLCSLLLHVLAMLIYQKWIEEPVEHALHPLRFQVEREAPDRFEPTSPASLPEVQMERLKREERPSELPVEAVDQIGVVDELHVPLSAEDVFLPTDESPGRETSRDSLLSLDEVQLEMVRRRTEELEQYERLWLPDADTSDVESRSRLLAQEVVQRAIEAMGGVAVLTAIRDMSYQGRYHKAYGTHSKYAQFLPGGAKVIFDGERGWIDVFGEAYPLKERGLHEVEYRAERWDFLSRYLGDGIQLSYLGKWVDADERLGPANRAYHVLLVEDFKFDSAFRALFDEEAHLLRVEEHPAEKPTVRQTYLDYGAVGRVYIWQQVEIYQLHKIRYARSYFPVNYGAIDDAVFATSKPDTGWGRLEGQEIAATLWVDVQMSNYTLGRDVLFMESLRLNGLQREMVRKQVESIVIGELNRRGLFARVEPKKNALMAENQGDVDFVLVLLIPPFDFSHG